MAPWKKLCSLVALIALLTAPGCHWNMGYRTVNTGTTEERVPISRAGPIQSMVNHAPPDQVVLQLTQQTQEEVRSVVLMQRVRVQFDLTGLAVAAGICGFAMFILLIVVAINSDGSSSGGSDWDWD